MTTQTEASHPWIFWSFGKTHDLWWPLWRSTRITGRARVGAYCVYCNHYEELVIRVPRFGLVEAPVGKRHPAREKFISEHLHLEEEAL